MKLKALLVAASLAVPTLVLAAAPAPVGKYDIDPAHSKVGFEVTHLVISTVEGRFDKFGGSITIADPADKSSVETKIDAGSVNTGNTQRDGHLKSPDFFDAAKFPELTFQSKKVAWNGSDIKITGDLTIHGVTKEVVLDGKFLGAIKDMAGNDRVAFSASTKISRKEFNVLWNKAIEAGPIVGDEVTIKLRIEAAKAKA